MFRRVGAEPVAQNPEEKAWQLKALGAAPLDQYTDEDFMDDVELNDVCRLFGLYLKKRVPKFGKLFCPATHSKFETD